MRIFLNFFSNTQPFELQFFHDSRLFAFPWSLLCVGVCYHEGRVTVDTTWNGVLIQVGK